MNPSPKDGAAALYEERCILQHTLGLDRSGVAYRNFFKADEGHADMPTLERLVENGFMVKETVGGVPGFIFRATAAGRDFLREGSSS